MIFNSLEYFVFLIIVLTVYYSVNRKSQNIWLLGASYLFYSFWDWRFLGLIIISTVTDYICGRIIGDDKSGPRDRKIALITSLTVNIGLLGFFKYFNFFIDSTVTLLETIGLQANISTLEIILPES